LEIVQKITKISEDYVYTKDYPLFELFAYTNLTFAKYSPKLYLDNFIDDFVIKSTNILLNLNIQ